MNMESMSTARKMSVIVALIAGAPNALALPARYSEPVDCARSEYIYDAKKLTEEQLVALLALSPRHQNDWSPDRGLFHCPPEVKSCDSGFETCADFGFNAEYDLRPIKEPLDRLHALKVPKELQPIADYYEGRINFRFWQQSTIADYVKGGWKTVVLVRKYEKLDPEKQCGGILAAIEKAPSYDEKWRAAHVDWANCVNGEFQKKIGGYPTKAWDQFMKAYGIRYEYEITEPDCD